MKAKDRQEDKQEDKQENKQGNLSSSLKKLREPKDETPKGQRRMVLSELDYNKDFSIEQFDAALIDIVKKQFGITQDMDLLLMAFGLLKGYYYGDIPSITDRRDKYLRETNFINKEQIAYKDMDEKDRTSCRENLRKGREESCISLLAKVLLNDIKIEVFMKLHEKQSSVKLQRPYYLQKRYAFLPIINVLNKITKLLISVPNGKIKKIEVEFEEGELKKLTILCSVLLLIFVIYGIEINHNYRPSDGKPKVAGEEPEPTIREVPSSIYVNEEYSGVLEEPVQNIALNDELN